MRAPRGPSPHLRRLRKIGGERCGPRAATRHICATSEKPALGSAAPARHSRGVASHSHHLKKNDGRRCQAGAGAAVFFQSNGIRTSEWQVITRITTDTISNGPWRQHYVGGSLDADISRGSWNRPEALAQWCPSGSPSLGPRLCRR